MNKTIFAVRRLLGISYITLLTFGTLSFAFIVSIEWFHWPPDITKELRSVIVLASCTPAFVFLMGLYLYEHRTTAEGLTRQECLSALAVGGVLLLPASFLVYRFEAPGSYRQLLISVIALPWIVQMSGLAILHATDGEEKSRLSRVIGFLRRVMSDDSNDDAATSPSTASEIEAFKRQRSALYLDKESLEVFQASLTCQKKDSGECAALFAGANARREIRLLDVGGGDGEFTFFFLQGLADKGFKTSEVVVVEPGDWKREYEALVGEIAITVDFRHVGFQSYQPNAEPFDIVMASHSLYGLFDLYHTSDEERKESIGKLVNMAKPGGYVFILLAAPHAQSYYFKAEALKGLFGWEPPDTSSATVKATLSDRGFSRKYIDNVIIMEELLREARGGSPERLLRWLSYFLRADCVSLAGPERDYLIAKLMSYVVKCESLTEEFAVELQTISEGLITPKSNVIPHKTALYSWQKSK